MGISDDIRPDGYDDECVRLSALGAVYQTVTPRPIEWIHVSDVSAVLQNMILDFV